MRYQMKRPIPNAMSRQEMTMLIFVRVRNWSYVGFLRAMSVEKSTHIKQTVFVIQNRLASHM